MLDVMGYMIPGLFLLIVPGFLFSLVLYPKLESLDFWGRMGMSLALGVMLVIYMGYFLARPELAMLQLSPFLGLTAGICAVLAVLAYFRGGFEVITAYTRAVTRFFRKFKPPKLPRPPSPPPPEQLPKEPKVEPEGPPPEQPQEAPKEKPEERAPEQPEEQAQEQQIPEQPPEQRGEVG